LVSVSHQLRELGRIAARLQSAHCALRRRHVLAIGSWRASRLLCSQTPIIFVLSVCETHSVDESKGPSPPICDRIMVQTEKGAWGHSSVVDTEPSMNAQDAADLRRGFSAVWNRSAAPAVISDADGWITHANTSALPPARGVVRNERWYGSGRHARSIHTHASLAPCPARCRAREHERNYEIGALVSGSLASEHGPHRLAYFDS